MPAIAIDYIGAQTALNARDLDGRCAANLPTPTEGLISYLRLATGAHARIRDEAWRCGSAAVPLGWSGLSLNRMPRASPELRATLGYATIIRR